MKPCQQSWIVVPVPPKTEKTIILSRRPPAEPPDVTIFGDHISVVGMLDVTNTCWMSQLLKVPEIWLEIQISWTCLKCGHVDVMPMEQKS